MEETWQAPDPIDAVLGDRDHPGDLTAVAALIHDLRSEFVSDAPLDRSASLRVFTDPVAVPAPRRTRTVGRRGLQATGAGIVGKVILGSTFAAASVGGLDAAGFVHMPSIDEVISQLDGGRGERPDVAQPRDGASTVVPSSTPSSDLSSAVTTPTTAPEPPARRPAVTPAATVPATPAPLSSAPAASPVDATAPPAPAPPVTTPAPAASRDSGRGHGLGGVVDHHDGHRRGGNHHDSSHRHNDRADSNFGHAHENGRGHGNNDHDSGNNGHDRGNNGHGNGHDRGNHGGGHHGGRGRG